MSEAPSQLIADRYRLVEPLGQGGMGRVWKAIDEVLHREVAIKELVPPPGLTPDERREMRERSLREARAIARLNNINVVRVFDVLRTDGDPWIVMEYVRSRSLQDTLAADGPVTPAKAVEIGLGVLGALKAAHKAGVMHRDVKPGNVLLGDDGRVVLTDFGLATVPGDPNVTRTGLVLGSPAYIAPERARDGTAGPEADLWSLGATLYAAVEGQSPYARSSAIATLAALATEPPPVPKRAGPLKPVLSGLLRKDPAERITADVAERLLRRASDKRTRGSISLLDGVRRPSPHGAREPRGRVRPLPAQRQPQEQPVEETPTPGTSAAAGAAAGVAAVPETDRSPTTSADEPADVASPAETAASGASAASGGSGASSAGAAETDGMARAGDGTAKSGASTPTPTPTDRTEVDGRPVVPDPPVVPGVPVSAGAGPTEVVGVARVGRSGAPAVLPTRGTAYAGGGKRDSFLTQQRWVLIGGLVVLLLLALVVVVPLANRGGDDTPTTAGKTEGPAQPTATGAASPPAVPPGVPSSQPTSVAPTQASPSVPASAGPPGASLPAGWRLHKDRTGFSVPVPEGWRIEYDGPRIQFHEPNGGRMLMIDQTDNPQPDPVADWERQERLRLNANRYRNYKRVKIEAVDYFLKAADWEWTYTSNSGNPLHVLNRGFVTGPKQAYAIYWSTSADDWNDSLDELKIVTEGFQPRPN